MLSGARLYLIHFLFKVLPETRCYGVKRQLLRFAGAKVGYNVRVCSSVHIIGNGTLEIGDGTFIGPLTFIHVTSIVKIGANCNISSRVTILNGSHDVDLSGCSIAGKGKSEDVKIGDGCWICTNVVVLGTSEIGDKCLVASGAITKGCYPSGHLLKGIIAKSNLLL